MREKTDCKDTFSHRPAPFLPRSDHCGCCLDPEQRKPVVSQVVKTHLLTGSHHHLSCQVGGQQYLTFLPTVFCSAWLPLPSKELAAGSSSGCGQVADCAPGSRAAQASKLPRSAHADRRAVRPCQRARAHCPRHNLWQGRASPKHWRGHLALMLVRGRRVSGQTAEDETIWIKSND